jgi:hypothetical protein
MIWRFWSIDWWGTQWHCVKIGIRNIIFWLPVVYLDRWWDHSFLYSILRHKLSQMERGFRLHGMSTNSEKDAKNIKICILLLDRLINNDYIDYMQDIGWEPKVRFSFEKEEEMINQDLNLLFKILRKQIRCWWD